ncbi:hypothetical protein [Mycobacterium sp. UM_Kg1]|uniref:hypothetical protein n=1 Tax=Mycobacterium sp. UM_Kg1 TaxID=1545691 RepID=UPI000AE02ED4|nr:hypothetical protein [Mycobacterium sp. UM_Kg1]
MTDVVSTPPAEANLPSSTGQHSLRMLAGARAQMLAGLIVPPSHEPVLDVVAAIWLDGVETGLTMSEAPAGTLGLADDLAGALYDELAAAGFCSEYAEFPELDDPDFQELAYGRVSKLAKAVQPIGHPEVTWDLTEIWTDGVAAALRVARRQAQ